MINDGRKDSIVAGYREGTVSIIFNTLLFALKYWAGAVTGSIALLADAWHTLSDSLSSIIVLLVSKLSTKRADREHPFGYGRYEQLGAIFIGVLLAIVAYDFAKDSIHSLANRQSTVFGTLAIVVTVISILAKEGLAQYAFHLARKTGNTAIKADGWHHRTDALSSVVVLAGIFLADYFWWIDGVLGLIIAAMLFWTTYEIIREAVDKLLGGCPDEAFVESLKTVIYENFGQRLDMHHFHVHDYNTHKELTFHIRFDGNKTLNECHEIASHIESYIKERYDMDTTIHMEPYDAPKH